MWRYLPAFAALPLIVAFGVAEGLWTGRWVTNPAAEQAAARLALVPLTVGDWDGEEKELDARQVVKAELSGYRLRQYVNRTSGATLSVLLVCGRPGPIAVHTPDVCYGGVGFNMVGPALRDPITADGANSFKVGRFSKTGAPVPEYLRIFWAWSTAGHTWSAPDNERFAFASAPVLYKLYVIRPLADLNEALNVDPAMDFLRQFLPMVDKAINAPAE